MRELSVWQLKRVAKGRFVSITEDAPPKAWEGRFLWGVSLILINQLK